MVGLMADCLAEKMVTMRVDVRDRSVDTKKAVKRGG